MSRGGFSFGFGYGFGGVPQPQPAAQTDVLRFVAGQRRCIGPRFVYDPSTGERMNLSGYFGQFVIRDYPNGAAVVDTNTSAPATGSSMLYFSPASAGVYYIDLFAAETSAYGGVDAWWELKISAPGAGGKLTAQRGKIQFEHQL